MKHLCCLLIGLLVAGTAHAEVDRSRPLAEAGPTPVYVSVFIVDVDGIDSAQQSFDANVYFKVRWKDDRLAHGGKGNVVYDPSDIWTPRYQPVNRQKTFDTFPQVIEVTPEGEAIYMQRVWGAFSQPLHLRDFPFDEQTFTVHFVAPGFTTEQIAFEQDPRSTSGMATVLSLPDWEILAWEAAPAAYQPTPNSVQTPGFRVAFTARRGTGYYLLKVILPLLLIVMMSWVVFWIDPMHSGTQIGVSMSAMLTLIAYRFAVGADIPRISYLTRMDYFILVATILVFASLVEVVITSHLAQTERPALARRIDSWMRIGFPLALAILTLKAFFL